MMKYCDNCGEELNPEKVYSNRGFSHICCSGTCLAYLCLGLRIDTLDNTLIAMGFKEETQSHGGTKNG